MTLPRRIALILVVTATITPAAYAAQWMDVATISSTLGNTKGYLCTGAGKTDVGCPTYAPYVTTGGLVGIGTTNPSTTLHLVGNQVTGILSLQNLNNNGYSSIDFYNPTGNAVLGLGVGNSGATANFQNRAYLNTNARDLLLARGTSTVDFILKGTTGYIGLGMGVNTPSTSLHVSGTIRIADGGENCDANRLGALRYDSTTNSFYACQSVANGWEPLATGGISSTLDRITSNSQAGVFANSTGYISLTTGGVTGTAYFTPTGKLINSGVSTTGAISGTTGYFNNFQVGDPSTFTNAISPFQSYGNIIGNYTGIGGVEMRNTNAGANADFRFVLSDERGASGNYLAFSMPSSNNSNLLFSNPRNQLAALFVSNGTTAPAAGRALALGTVSANPIIFGTSNTEQMRITSNGLVGIGTTAPSAALQVSGTGLFSVADVGLYNSNGRPSVRLNSGGIELRDNSDYLAVRLSNNSTSQNLLANKTSIGKTSIPTTMLDVSGSIRLAAETSATLATCDVNRLGAIKYEGAEFQVCRNATNGWEPLATGGISSTLDRITSNSQAGVFANATGYVSLTTGGVTGTVYFDPAGRLVNSGVSTTGTISGTNIYSTGYVQATTNMYNGGNYYTGNGKGLSWGPFGVDNLAILANSTASNIQFKTSSTEAMRITSDSRVGIGTTDPSATLHISGTGLIVGNQSTSSGFLKVQSGYGGAMFWGEQLVSTYTNPLGIFHAKTQSTLTSSTYFFKGVDRNNIPNFYARGDGQGYFSDSLGIGTTTPSSTLHVIGSGLFSTNLGVGGVVPAILSTTTAIFANGDITPNSLILNGEGYFIGYGIYWDGFNFRYRRGGQSGALIRMGNAAQGQGGDLQFTTVSQGVSAGDIATGANQRMVIKNNGRIGISSDPATLLDVSGTIRMSNGGESCDVSRTGAMKFQNGSFYVCQTTANGWEPLATTTSNSVPSINTGLSGSVVYRDEYGYLKANGNFSISATTGTLSVGGVAPSYVGSNGIYTGGSLYSTYAISIGTNDQPLQWGNGYTSIQGTGSGINQNMKFNVSNTEALRIVSTGLVGIGTTTPGAQLDVNGIIRTNNGFVVTNAGGMQISGSNLDVFTNRDLTFSPSRSEAMRITSTGLVGIGTTAPSVPFHVSTQGGAGAPTTISSRTVAIFENGNSSGAVISLLSKATGGAYSGIFFGTNGGNQAAGQLAYLPQNSAFRFLTNGGNSGANGMFMSNIGTYMGPDPLAPSTTLTVGGAIRLGADVSATFNTCDTSRLGAIKYESNSFQICQNTSNGWEPLATSGPTSLADRITSNSQAGVIANATGYISLTTGGVTGTVYFDPAGRLVNAGVSTTGPISATSAYLSGPSNALRIDNSAVLGFATGAGTLNFGNSTARVAGSAKSDGTSSLALTTSNTIAMYISSSGQVGIGTTAPSSTLHLAGSTDIAGGLTIGDTSGNSRLALYPSQGSTVAADLKLLGTSGVLRVVDSTGSNFMRIQSNTPTGGSLGLGGNWSGATPSATLHVSGSQIIQGSSTTEAIGLTLTNTGNAVNAGNAIEFNNINNGLGARAKISAIQSSITPGSRSTDLAFYTEYQASGSQYTEVMRIVGATNTASATNRAVGIRTSTPTTVLTVNGTIRMADSGEACDINRIGAMKYSGSAFYVCQTAANGWEPLATTTSSSTPSISTGASGSIVYRDQNGYLQSNSNWYVSGTNISLGTPYSWLGNMTNTLWAQGGIYTDGYVRSGNRFTFGDGTTGLYGSSANGGNNFASIVVSSTEALRIVSTGYVGIGTTDPSQTLDVYGNAILGKAGATGQLYFRRSDGGINANIGYISGTGSDFAFTNSSNGSKFQWFLNISSTVTESMRLTTSATGPLLGVGTAIPSATLHVKGTLRIADGGEACDTNRLGAIRYTSGAFYICQNTITGWETLASTSSNTTVAINTGTSGSLVYRNEFGVLMASNSIYISATTGSIGIGAAPQASNNGLYAAGFVQAGAAVFAPTVYALNGPVLTLSSTVPLVRSASGPTDPSLSLASGFNMPESLRLVSSGYVGIGTTNPAMPLDVSGTARANSLRANISIRMTDPTFNFNRVELTTISDSGIVRLYDTSGNNNLTLNSSGTSFIRGGNLGIGTGAGASTTLHVSGTIRMADGGETCDANRLGAMKYSAGAFYICQSTITGWETLASTSSNTTIAINTGVSGSLVYRNEYGVLMATNTLSISSTTGSVGIGAGPPSWLGSYGLYAAGGVAGQNFNVQNANGGILWGAGGTKILGSESLSGSGPYISLLASNTEALRIVSNGMVGIGTSTPSSTLHLAGTTSGGGETIGAPGLIIQRTNNSNPTGHIFFMGSGGINSNFWSITTDPYNPSSTASGFSLGYGLNGGVGASKMFIDVSGSIGVGTTAPSTTLHIHNANNPTSLRLSRGVAYVEYQSPQGSPFVANTMVNNGTNLVTATSIVVNTGGGYTAGNVGFGTSAPWTKADISGTLRIANGGESCDVSRTGAIKFTGTAFQICQNAATGWESLASTSSNTTIAINTGVSGSLVYRNEFGVLMATNTLSISSTTGSVGIGAGAPVALGNNGLYAAGNMQTDGTMQSAGSYTFNSTGARYLIWNNLNGASILGDPASKYLAFSTSSTEVMRITSDSRVGIATTTPDNNAYMTIGNPSSAYISLVLRRGTGNEPGISFISGNNNGVSATNLRGLADGGLRVTDGSGSNESVRITSSGLVGIGSPTPNAALEISTSAAGVRSPTLIVRGTSYAGIQFMTANSNTVRGLIRTDGGGNMVISPNGANLLFGNDYTMGIAGFASRVGILVGADPSTTLHVNGSIRLGAETSTTLQVCDVNRLGAIKYESGTFQICQNAATGWESLASTSSNTTIAINTGVSGSLVYRNEFGVLMATNTLSISSTTGSVGIGAGPPSSLGSNGLYTSGQIFSDGPAIVTGFSNTNTSSFGFGNSTVRILGDARAANQYMAFQTSGTTAMTIVSTGYVGIGTSTPPSTTLHIARGITGGAAAAAANQRTVAIFETSNTTGAVLQLLAPAGSTNQLGIVFGTPAQPNTGQFKYWPSLNRFDWYTGNQETGMTFGNPSGTANDSRLGINLVVSGSTYGAVNPSATLHVSGTTALMGNVGIGTLTPSTTLHVSGTIRIADGLETCDTNRLGAIKYTSGAFYVCQSVSNGWEALGTTGANANNDRIISGTTQVITYNNTSVSLVTAGTERVVIGTNGLIGIGQQPQANVPVSISGTTSIVGRLGLLTPVSSNVYVGSFSGANSSGANNSAFGLYAGQANSGSSVALFGHYAGQNNTGNNLTAMGLNAGMYNVGDAVVAIGQNSAQYNSSTNVTAVGFQAGQYNSGTAVTALGYYAGRSNNAVYLTAVGYQTAQNNTGFGLAALGYQAGQSNTGGTGVAMGYQAAQTNSGDSLTAVGYQAAQNNPGTNVTAIGYASGQNNTSNNLAAMGFKAAQANTGSNTTAVGFSAAQNNTGSNVAALGMNAAQYNTGADVVALGFQSAQYNAGNTAVAIGSSALQYTIGTGNVGIGKNTLQSVSNTGNINWNTAVGTFAGQGLTTGSNSNTLIGYSAGNGITTGTANVLLGAGTAPFSNTGSYQLNIGNAIWGNIGSGNGNANKIGINVTSPTANLEVSGTISATQIFINGQPLAASGNDDRIISGTTQAIAYNNTSLSLVTAGTERMVIGTNGNIGIATQPASNYPVSISGTTQITGRIAISTATGSNVLVGSSAGIANTGTNVAAFGQLAAQDNTGNLLTAVGTYAASSNTGIYTTSIGAYSGFKNTGSNLTAVGYQASSSNTANYVTAVGASAAAANTGDYATAIGYSAGQNNNSYSFTAVGYNAGQNNSGTNVTAIGVAAGRYSVGANLTAVGSSAAVNNSGTNVTAIGNNAGVANTGANLTAVGQSAAQNNTGAHVTAVGLTAGQNNTATGLTAIGATAAQYNTSGLQNTAVGYTAIQYNTTGQNNTALGYGAGRGVSNSSIFSNNTLIGYNTGFVLTTGGSNTLLGANAGGGITTGTNNLILGANTSPLDNTGSNQLNIANAIFGDYSRSLAARIGINVTSPTTALEVSGTISATAITINGQSITGQGASTFASLTDVSYSLAGGNIFGPGSLTGANSSVSSSTAFGVSALSAAGNTGSLNTAFGNSALKSNTSGVDNNAFGYGALSSNLSGNNNAAFGRTTMQFSTTGNNNTALGSWAMRYGNGSQNTAVGFQSLQFNGAVNNSALGVWAGIYNTGSFNTFVGNYAGQGVSNSSPFNGATLLGSYAGSGLTTGNSNTLIGYNAGGAITTGANNIVLGYNLSPFSNTGSNQLNIGNSIFGDIGGGVSLTAKIGINVTSPTTALEVSGTIKTNATLQAGNADQSCANSADYGKMRFDATTRRLYLCRP